MKKKEAVFGLLLVSTLERYSGSGFGTGVGDG
jgi:hypothetical protein